MSQWSWSPMKVGQPRSDYISRLPHWSSNWRRLKILDNYQGSDSYKNEFLSSEDDMISEGSEDHINENESQQEVSPRLKQKEITEK